MSDIVLCTLNARFSHSSLGLRYLYANMGPLQARSKIHEFNINQNSDTILEQILKEKPLFVAFGVYIWNIRQTTDIVEQLKVIQPDINVIIGGPEVSYELDQQRIVQLADYVVTGQADLSFPQLCQNLLLGLPQPKTIHSPVPSPLDITMPYRYYTDADIAHRVIYVEASRGCPFKCEFCLSALDKKVQPFDIPQFLAELDTLYSRGARHFKFVDRTFNLNMSVCEQILNFFLERLDDRLFLHFELIPDRLPDALKTLIQRFPSGSLQFEVGVQTLNPNVQTLISRKQDNNKTRANLTWLQHQSGVHLHADLIAGLPGEDMASFADSFDQLVDIGLNEIQVGILKRLRGSPICRHIDRFNMRFNPLPPYNLLCADYISFDEMQRITRFARYWDLIANSGRFIHTRQTLLGDQPFSRFMTLSDWLYRESGQTHQIALKRLFSLIYQGAIDVLDANPEILKTQLQQDYARAKMKGPLLLEREKNTATSYKPQRQQRHLI